MRPDTLSAKSEATVVPPSTSTVSAKPPPSLFAYRIFIAGISWGMGLGTGGDAPGRSADARHGSDFKVDCTFPKWDVT